MPGVVAPGALAPVPSPAAVDVFRMPARRAAGVEFPARVLGPAGRFAGAARTRVGVAVFPSPAGPRGLGFAASPRSVSSAARSVSRVPVVPVVPGGVGVGGVAGAGVGAGGLSGAPGALVVGLFVLALGAGYRFVFAAAGFRSAAFISLVERPG
jgi:hypothetical protein